MAKEPWEEDIYDDGEETLKRTSKLNGIKADRLLTILAIIFFVVVVAMVCLLIFLSTGGSNKSKQMSGFYNGETKVEQKSSAPAAQTDQAAKDDSSKDENAEEGTITVQAGEGGICSASWYFHCPIGTVKSISHVWLIMVCESW